MMTYLPERKILFSGDAFGMFGASDGSPLDNETDLRCFPDEMYRYYSNIVGKYGRFVQTAIKKTSDLEIEYICSTHGPVWHEKINEVCDIYNRLSQYEPENGVVIVYGSMYGNTARLAEDIAAEFVAQGERNIRIYNAAVTPLSYLLSDIFRYRTLVVGSATYQMDLFPPIDNLMKALASRGLQNRTIATFGSFTWAKGCTLKKFEEYCSQMNTHPVASLEMKQNDRGCVDPVLQGYVSDIIKASRSAQ